MSNKNLSKEFQEVIKSEEYVQIKDFYTSKVKKYTDELDTLTDEYLKKLDLNLNILKQRHKISDFTINSEKKSIQSRLKKIHKLYKILENEQYNIAFIGKVGVGKTSAIAHSLDLTYKKMKKNRHGKLVEDKKLREILPVNTGNTTVCEVRLKFTNDISSIEIIPYSKDEFNLEIIETINQIKDKKIDTSIEVSRAIKNMVNYSDWSEEEKEKFQNLSQKDAEKIFFDKLNFDKRTTTKIVYTSDIEEKAWLEEEVRKINYGENENCSLPKSIILNINLKLVTKNINKDYMIIDTKGFKDENVVGRTDILSYMREENTICILCSSYNDAPEHKAMEILELAKKNQTKNKFTLSKLGLLIIDKNNSQNAKDNQGMDIDDRDAVLNIKEEHIQSSFQNKNLHHANIPIEFYDINEDDNIILLEFLDKTIKNYNNKILNLVENNILNLWEYCYHLPFEIEKRRENREKIKKIFIEELENVKKNFLPQERANLKYKNPLDKYYGELFSIHHMKIMALNRRRGYYDGFNNHQSIDYYLKEFIVQELSEIKKIFWASFTKKIANSIKDKELDKVLQTLEYRFDENLETAIEKVYESIIFDYLTNDFYREVQNFWGAGEGYLKKVRKSYQKQFNEIFQNLLTHIRNESDMVFSLLNYEK